MWYRHSMKIPWKPCLEERRWISWIRDAEMNPLSFSWFLNFLFWYNWIVFAVRWLLEERMIRTRSWWWKIGKTGNTTRTKRPLDWLDRSCISKMKMNCEVYGNRIFVTYSHSYPGYKFWIDKLTAFRSNIAIVPK